MKRISLLEEPDQSLGNFMRFCHLCFLILLLLAAPTALFAHSPGDMKSIDGLEFTYKNGRWVQSSIDNTSTFTRSYSTVYKDKKWAKWYQEGDSTLKKILDLGPDVTFRYKGADGKWHVYGSFKNKKFLMDAVGSKAASFGAGGAAGSAASGAAASGSTILGMSTTTAAVIGGAVVAGGVIIENNDDDEEMSPFR